MANKKPRHAVSVRPFAKIPRSGQQVDVQTKNFCWRLSDLDWDGPWGWSRADSEPLLKDTIPKLHDYETMTWGNIEGPTGSHFVEFQDLCPAAQKRLVEIGRDEQARLFSVRLSGEIRVWGIRDIAILRVLWWDPDHTVCPSIKKHT